MKAKFTTEIQSFIADPRLSKHHTLDVQIGGETFRVWMKEDEVLKWPTEAVMGKLINDVLCEIRGRIEKDIGRV
jgi:hypothetical protein